MRLRFGECVLDTDARQLLRSGRDVHLSPKAFELLRLLAECSPRAVSKQELLDHIWPDVFVSDASLARVVNEVRDTIGDRARAPRWLRTVHAFGYAFAGITVENDPSPPVRSSCLLISEDRRSPLVEGEQVIGRDPDAAVTLDSPRVSRHHARIVVRGASATIEDLQSKNGTYVDGVRIAAVVQLKTGDTIRIGPFTLIFAVSRPASSTETEIVEPG